MRSRLRQRHLDSCNETRRLVVHPISLPTAARNFILPLTTALALVLTGCDQLSLNKEINPELGSNDPGYSILGAELIETDANGLPRYRLRAERIVQDPISLLIEIDKPVLGINEQGSPAWTVSADHGQLPGHARAISLAGHVEVNSARQNERPSLQIAADSLDYDFSSYMAKTDDVVSLTVEGHQLRGVGLEADLRRRQARIKESVQGRFEP